MKDVEGTIYLLHFEQPYRHAQHYLGWASDVQERLASHIEGKGNPLVAAAVASGSEVRVVRTWTGTRTLERKLKKQKNACWLCPICKPSRAKRKAKTRRSRKRERRTGVEVSGPDPTPRP